MRKYILVKCVLLSNHRNALPSRVQFSSGHLHINEVPETGKDWRCSESESLLLCVKYLLAETMSTSIFRFLILLGFTFQFLAILCNSFSPEHPTDRRVLILLDDFAIKSSHSIFFKSLENRGFELDFKLADDPKIALQRFGQYLYDALILFSPSIDRASF